MVTPVPSTIKFLKKSKFNGEYQLNFKVWTSPLTCPQYRAQLLRRSIAGNVNACGNGRHTPLILTSWPSAATRRLDAGRPSRNRRSERPDAAAAAFHRRKAATAAESTRDTASSASLCTTARTRAPSPRPAARSAASAHAAALGNGAGADGPPAVAAAQRSFRDDAAASEEASLGVVAALREHSGIGFAWGSGLL
jgi:hypothetical protein